GDRGRRGRDALRGREGIARGLVAPKERRQGAFAFDERLGAASIVDHGFDLAAVADDALVGEEALDVACGEPRDAVEIEVVEGGAEVLALGEDRAPAEARLKSLEAELLEQATVVAHGVAPFVVVIGDVLRRGAAPPAALQA